MKFSWAYVKQNKVMFGTIAVVFGLLLWVWLNRGASETTTVIQGSSGPSDAAIASNNALAAAQLAASSQTQQAQITAQMGQNIAQIQANRDLGISNLAVSALSQQGRNDASIANINANVSLADIAAAQRTQLAGIATSAAVAISNIEAGREIQLADISATRDVQLSSIGAGVAIATKAYDASVTNTAIMAETYRQFSADQLAATEASIRGQTVATLAGEIDSLRSVDRDNALALLTATYTGSPTQYIDRTSGSFIIN